MKKSGSKNDGKWFRFNKALAVQREVGDGESVLGLQAIFDNAVLTPIEFGGAPSTAAEMVTAYFVALQDIATKTGVEFPASPANGSALISRYISIGFPRQVWMGKLSFDTYTEAAGVWKADHQAQAHGMGKLVRKLCSQWLYGLRAINDLTDTGLATEGNPGGQPDAVQGN